MGKNKNLNKANKAKNDEFYTQTADIENELRHYKHHFKDKIVFLNCDDPEESNFWKYFQSNFNYLGLKKLISTHYDKDKPTYKLEMDADGIKKTPLQQNGDFRSPECVALLEECDIVVTNPPFSLLREYLLQLVQYDKKFLIIANQNTMTTKELFPLFQRNIIWYGYGFNKGNAFFEVRSKDFDPNDYAKGVYDPQTNLVKFRNCCWVTNLDHTKRHEEQILWKTYNPTDYPKYDNYEAIEVGKIAEIPKDYEGIMGVPISFLQIYSPEQFEIVGLDRYTAPKEALTGGRFTINGKSKYARILIRRKK